LKFNGASTAITYDTQQGFYSQIGAIVYYTFFIRLTSKGVFAATDPATITGLPIVAATDISFATQCCVDSVFASDIWSFVYNDSGTLIYLQKTNEITNANAPLGADELQYQDFTDTSFFSVSGTYLAL